MDFPSRAAHARADQLRRRHVVWNGGYFGCIFQVRALLPKAEVQASFPRGFGAELTHSLQTKPAELFNNFLSGMVGGFVGTALNTPCALPPPSSPGHAADRFHFLVDVVKSRVQNSIQVRPRALLCPLCPPLLIPSFPGRRPNPQIQLDLPLPRPHRTGRRPRRALLGLPPQGPPVGPRRRCPSPRRRVHARLIPQAARPAIYLKALTYHKDRMQSSSFSDNLCWFRTLGEWDTGVFNTSRKAMSLPSNSSPTPRRQPPFSPPLPRPPRRLSPRSPQNHSPRPPPPSLDR